MMFQSRCGLPTVFIADNIDFSEKNTEWCWDFCRVMKAFGSSWKLEKTLFDGLQQLVCELYGVKEKSINTTRYILFCSKSLDERKLPPNEDCLMQHSLKANYQSKIYKSANISVINSPRPSCLGWEEKNGRLIVTWMTIKVTPPELMSRVKCACKASKCDTKSCSCKNAGIPCTDICMCISCINHTDLEEENVFSDPSEPDLSDED